jgi:hypothetical protein
LPPQRPCAAPNLHYREQLADRPVPSVQNDRSVWCWNGPDNVRYKFDISTGSNPYKNVNRVRGNPRVIQYVIEGDMAILHGPDNVWSIFDIFSV